MLIFNPIQDLHPGNTYTKKMKSKEKNSSYHPDTDGGQMGGRTDGRSDEQGESSIPPSTSLWGYKKPIIEKISKLTKAHVQLDGRMNT